MKRGSYLKESLFFLGQRTLREELLGQSIVAFGDHDFKLTHPVNRKGIYRLGHLASQDAGDPVALKESLDDISLHGAHHPGQLPELHIFIGISPAFVFHDSNSRSRVRPCQGPIFWAFSYMGSGNRLVFCGGSPRGFFHGRKPTGTAGLPG